MNVSRMELPLRRENNLSCMKSLRESIMWSMGMRRHTAMRLWDIHQAKAAADEVVEAAEDELGTVKDLEVEDVALGM